jgi:hypothetical protein
LFFKLIAVHKPVTSLAHFQPCPKVKLHRRNGMQLAQILSKVLPILIRAKVIRSIRPDERLTNPDSGRHSGAVLMLVLVNAYLYRCEAEQVLKFDHTPRKRTGPYAATP